MQRHLQAIRGTFHSAELPALMYALLPCTVIWTAWFALNYGHDPNAKLVYPISGISRVGLIFAEFANSLKSPKIDVAKNKPYYKSQ